jgi:pyrroline-5-carboxylate reductase
MKLLVIGGGRMGEALLGGLVKAKWATADQLAVVEPIASRRAALERALPGVTVGSTPVTADVALIAVKPHDVPAACASIANVGASLVISIAAGITLTALESMLPAGSRVVRAMPNTPALVGHGAAGIAGGTACTSADLDLAREILSAVGVVVQVKESLLDAVTGLSGSGPAYVFLVAEAMIEAGVLVGLPRDVSTTLALATVAGAGRMLVESGRSPEVLRAEVTSPGGTTAAGLHQLELSGVRAAFLDAVVAATGRSIELGQA